MPMSDFYQVFPKLAETELRTATFEPGSATGLPGGRYGFVEAYCDGMGCDCRRVMIGVYSEQDRGYVAHINLGFDSDDEMAGPFLDPLDPQGPHAKELLAFFTDMINRDPAYLARLQRHYVQFKERLEGRRYAGRRFETPGRVTRVAVTAPMGNTWRAARVALCRSRRLHGKPRSDATTPVPAVRARNTSAAVRGSLKQGPPPLSLIPDPCR